MWPRPRSSSLWGREHSAITHKRAHSERQLIINICVHQLEFRLIYRGMALDRFEIIAFGSSLPNWTRFFNHIHPLHRHILCCFCKREQNTHCQPDSLNDKPLQQPAIVSIAGNLFSDISHRALVFLAMAMSYHNANSGRFASLLGVRARTLLLGARLDTKSYGIFCSPKMRMRNDQVRDAQHCVHLYAIDRNRFG